MIRGDSFRHDEQPPALTEDERRLVADFTRLYYRHWRHDSRGGSGSVSIGWMGWLAQKCPTDLWTCQEIIVETRPDVIIETGTCLGGSGLFMAHLCDMLGQGQVISVDITRNEGLPEHPRLTYLTGDSAAPDIVAQVKARIPAGARVMVILDSDHRAPHVTAELAAYAELVTPGCYLIVEDGVVNGNPVLPEYGPGPLEALREFVAVNPHFVIDRSRQRFLLTMNPDGFLRRVA
jgi:cephalosporin hydroxylase